MQNCKDDNNQLKKRLMLDKGFCDFLNKVLEMEPPSHKKVANIAQLLNIKNELGKGLKKRVDKICDPNDSTQDFGNEDKCNIVLTNIAFYVDELCKTGKKSYEIEMMKQYMSWVSEQIEIKHKQDHFQLRKGKWLTNFFGSLGFPKEVFKMPSVKGSAPMKRDEYKHYVKKKEEMGEKIERETIEEDEIINLRKLTDVAYCFCLHTRRNRRKFFRLFDKNTREGLHRGKRNNKNEKWDNEREVTRLSDDQAHCSASIIFKAMRKKIRRPRSCKNYSWFKE
jgi:hypothetical protein